MGQSQGWGFDPPVGLLVFFFVLVWDGLGLGL